MYSLFETIYHCLVYIFREQPCPCQGAWIECMTFVLLNRCTFLVPEDVSEQNVSEWVNSERFEAFVHVTRSNFHDITETGKYV